MTRSEKTEKEAPKVLFRAMDKDNVGLICTNDKAIDFELKAAVETGKAFYGKVTNGENGVIEPHGEATNFKANGIYPLKYLENFVRMAKKSGASKVKLELGEFIPLRMTFERPVAPEYKINSGNKTWMYVAPMME